ncbi:hypothetical protein N7539_000595 [Penicillium diatomitis]|uniref:Uncharacterized protein n=1 Tax=Penicillium diatomitis TaxID=2819901 RepID=A0A9W9XM37_9EURO|nr:uncharacterized protein N7539_000595 [Penicillium diatomitis]KAJ5495479.1 hypothetical protein N7539_000595 [Penicillium diatomitis]
MNFSPALPLEATNSQFLVTVLKWVFWGRPKLTHQGCDMALGWGLWRQHNHGPKCHLDTLTHRYPCDLDDNGLRRIRIPSILPVPNFLGTSVCKFEFLVRFNRSVIFYMPIISRTTDIHYSFGERHFFPVNVWSRDRPRSGLGGAADRRRVSLHQF